MSASLDKLIARLYDVNALTAALGIFGWDQQTFMPRGGAAARAEHTAILSRMAHVLFVADETRRLLEDAKKDAQPDTVEAATVRVVQRHLDMETKIPTELVERKARVCAQAHEAWVEARAQSDFLKFAPSLEQIVDIARQEAECLGYKEHIYDALIDQYEEGTTTKDCQAMFDTVRGPLVSLVAAIGEGGDQPDDRFLHGEWDKAQVSSFCRRLIRAMGFDWNRGRLDETEHPFTTGWSVGDIRLTTRYTSFLTSAIFGCMHEAGHGLYEQGSPAEWDRTPLAAGASLGLHESQSRLWENIVGRSKAFWRHYLPDLLATVPTMRKVALGDFHRVVNKVQPSLIRIEADEVTYNLHILIRFELECDLLLGKLAVKDLPEAWNAKVKDYLGIAVPNDAHGCLQDVHWSSGMIGYFPTYSIGNLLSYQFWAALQKDLGDTDELLSSGHLEPIHEWLRERIYSQGCRYQPKELVQRVTGKPMGADDYLAGITAKYKAVYNLA